MSPTEPAAAERAYTATKDLILDGDLAGGSLVSEGEIAERLAISRTPVREAFLRLQAEKLLTLHPKKPAVVVPVPPAEALDVLDVRLALESTAVRRLVRAADVEGALAPARDLLGRQGELARARSVREFAVADAEFHVAIVAASGNVVATEFYGSLRDRQRRMTIGAVGARPARLKELVAEHAALLQRLTARDAKGYESLLRKHFEATHALVVGR